MIELFDMLISKVLSYTWIAENAHSITLNYCFIVSKKSLRIYFSFLNLLLDN